MYTGEAISINKIFSTTNKARGQIVNKNRGVYTINGIQANEVKNKKKTEKYIKCSQLNTCIHGRRNGETHQNLWGEGFINENGTILIMICNYQVVYRVRKMITHWDMEKHYKNMEL